MASQHVKSLYNNLTVSKRVWRVYQSNITYKINTKQSHGIEKSAGVYHSNIALSNYTILGLCPRILHGPEIEIIKCWASSNNAPHMLCTR